MKKEDKNWVGAIEAIQNSSPESAVYIGCDSVRRKQKDNRWKARYDVLIVVHHSRDGCSIFHNTHIMDDYGNIRERMLNEVNFAVEAALSVVDILDGRRMDIHLDLNTDPQHKSNVAVKEAVGWVRGMFGFDPKLKPESWAATHAADHFAREKNT